MIEKLKDLLVILAAGTLAVSLFGLSWGRASAQMGCDVDCLNEKIAILTRRVAILEKAATAKTSRVKTATKESFLQIAGGSVVGGDWTKVEGADFWFDQSLYGTSVVVTWEGWLENGKGAVRLYDVTNSRAVDGSEVEVAAGGRASFYSRPLAIWRGQNQYLVQARNVNLEKVTITTPRLRILSK